MGNGYPRHLAATLGCLGLPASSCWLWPCDDFVQGEPGELGEPGLPGEVGMRVSIAESCLCSQCTDSSQGCKPVALDIHEMLGWVSASFSCNFIQLGVCLHKYNSSWILTKMHHIIEKCIMLYSSRDLRDHSTPIQMELASPLQLVPCSQ